MWWYLASAGKLAFDKPVKVHPDATEEFDFRQELGDSIRTIKLSRKTTNGAGAEFTVVMRQAPPQAHNQHPDVSALAESISLTSSDIGLLSKSSASLVPQVMSISTTRHLLVPLTTVKALNAAAVQRDSLLKQLQLVDEKSYGLYLFTEDPEGEKYQYQARFFSPGMSGENPAAGSVVGLLSKYLFEHDYLDTSSGQDNIKVRQTLLLR